MAILILLLVLWQTVPRWLPRVAAYWLPAGSQLTLQGPLRWQNGGLSLPGAQYKVQQCLLADLGATRLHYRGGRWLLDSDKLSVDSACLSQLPAGEDDGAPLTLDALQRQLPALDLSINQLSILPWQHYAGKLQLHNTAAGQRLFYQGKNLKAEALLNNQQQLAISSLNVLPPNSPHPLRFSGDITIARDFAALPPQGKLRGEVQTAYLQQPLLMDINWHQGQGVVTLTEKGDKQPLATLPWSVTPQQIRIDKGEWRWPYIDQPLSGGVNIALHDWSKGLDETQISARLNVITAGHNGKGNAVLTLGPGSVGLTRSNLDFN